MNEVGLGGEKFGGNIKSKCASGSGGLASQRYSQHCKRIIPCICTHFEDGYSDPNVCTSNEEISWNFKRLLNHITFTLYDSQIRV